MQRYKLTVEYFGGKLHGWQVQPYKLNLRTVQGELEHAIEKVVGPNNYNRIVTSSRTDAGVHALGNVCHVDITRRQRNNGTIIQPHCTTVLNRALNHFLQESPVSILKVEKVTNDFHARYHALGRKYIYRIMMPRIDHQILDNGINKSNVFQQPIAWYLDKYLDVAAMKEASKAFIGKHDFSSFRASKCQASSPIRTVECVQVDKFSFRERNEEIVLNENIYDLLQISVTAKSFLYHMVRNMVGCMYEVGVGKLKPHQVETILQSRDRSSSPFMAPAHGLFLTDVYYKT